MFVSDFVHRSQTSSIRFFGFGLQTSLTTNQIVKFLDLLIEFLEFFFLIGDLARFFSLAGLFLTDGLDGLLPLFELFNLFLFLLLLVRVIEQQSQQLLDSFDNRIQFLNRFLVFALIEQLRYRRHFRRDQRLFSFLVRFDESLVFLRFLVLELVRQNNEQVFQLIHFPFNDLLASAHFGLLVLAMTE